MSHRALFVVLFAVCAACSRQTETQLASSIPEETIVPQPEPVPEVDPHLTHEIEQRTIDSLANQAMLLLDDIEFGERWLRSEFARLHPITSEETYYDGSPLYNIPPDADPKVRVRRGEAQLRALAFFLDVRFTNLIAETFDRYPLRSNERESLERAYQQRDESRIKALLAPHYVEKANERRAVLTLLSEIEHLRRGDPFRFDANEPEYTVNWRAEHDAAIRRLSADIESVKSLPSAGTENTAALFQPRDFWLLSVPYGKESSIDITLTVTHSNGNVFKAEGSNRLSYAGFVLPDNTLLIATPYRFGVKRIYSTHATYIGRINDIQISGVAQIYREDHSNDSPFQFTLTPTDPPPPPLFPQRFAWPSPIGRPLEREPDQHSVNWFRDGFLFPELADESWRYASGNF